VSWSHQLPPHQVTHVTDGAVDDVASSHDGRLVIARSTIANNIVVFRRPKGRR